MGNMNYSDRELVDYTIKFSDDAEKVRLATIMERVGGAIIDDLVDAGMHETWCTFTSEWGGDYHPGRYISLLEDEIRIRDDDIRQLRKELEEQKARNIADLIVELHAEIQTSDRKARDARDQCEQAMRDSEHAKDRLSMWAKLNGDSV